MKTTVSKSLLVDATGAIKGLLQKDALSPFNRIRLDAAGNNVSLTASNSDVQVEIRFVGETTETDTVTLPGTSFVAFVGGMPDGSVEISGKPGQRVKMSDNKSVTFAMSSFEAADFPSMPGIESMAKISMTAVQMKELLRKVKFAASSDSTQRKVLTGVNVSMEDSVLSMTATDGRRLAHVELKTDPGEMGTSWNITLPMKAVNTLYGLLEKGEDAMDVTFEVGAQFARIVGSNWSMTTKLMADEYPGWKAVIPKTNSSAEINRCAFLDALGRAGLAASALTDNAVKIDIRDGRVDFEAKNEVTEAKAEISGCEVANGGKIKMLINAKLLSDVLTAIDDDVFTLEFTESGRPIALRCSIPWVSVIMPLRTK